MKRVVTHILFLGALFFLTWWILSDLSYRFSWDTGWRIDYIVVASTFLTVAFAVALWLWIFFSRNMAEHQDDGPSS